jgi:hypothetical protein
MLITYNTHTRNVEKALMEFSSVHQKIKSTIEKETHNKLIT